jgi:hypothetical protein
VNHGDWQELREMAWEWDPIGLGESRSSVEDEYDCIFGDVMPLLRKGASEEEITDFLNRLLPEHFGLESQPREAKVFARRIISWWEGHQP